MRSNEIPNNYLEKFKRCKQKIFETVKELTSKIFCLRKKFLVE